MRREEYTTFALVPRIGIGGVDLDQDIRTFEVDSLLVRNGPGSVRNKVFNYVYMRVEGCDMIEACEEVRVDDVV